LQFQVILSILVTIFLLFQSIKVTFNYLNFESIIVSRISDTILYGESIPDILVFLTFSNFNNKMNLNKIENMKFSERKNHINNVFDELLQESKLLFDCKMKKN
jgi:hypothetical protein